MTTSKKIFEIPNIHCRMKLEGHNDPIEDVDVDANYFYSASRDNTVRKWDKNSGMCVKIFEGHTGTVSAIAIENDIIVSGSLDKTIRLWDKESGECRQVFEGHTESVLDVAVKDKIIASCSGDCTIKIWDRESGSCVKTLEGHDRIVSSVAIKGEKLISGSWDHEVKVWDINTGECIKTLRGHGDAIECVSIEDNTIISGDQANMIIIWDLESGSKIGDLIGHNRMVMDLFLEGNVAYSCSKDKTIRLWDINTGYCLKKLEGHSDAILGVSKRENLIISSSADGTIRIWDDNSINSLLTLESHSDEVLAIAVDGDTLVSAGKDNVLKVWDLNNWRLIKDIPIPYKSWIWGLSLQGNKAILSSDDGTYRIIDTNTGKVFKKLEGHKSSTYRVASNENIVVTTSWDNRARIWDIESGNCLQILKGHTYSPYSAAITEDNKILTGSSDCTIRIWDRSGNNLRVLRGHTDEVFHIATEDNIVVSASADKSIKAFNTDNGKEINTLEGHKDQVLTVQIKNGIVFSGSLDKTIKIWDLKKGTCLKTLEGHTMGVKDLAIHKHNLISASYDNTIQVWDISPYIRRDDIDTSSELTENQDALVAQIQMGRTYEKIPPHLGDPDLIRMIHGLKPLDSKENIHGSEYNLPIIRGLVKNWRHLGRIGHAPWLNQLFTLVENEYIELGSEESLKTILDEFMVGLGESENLYWLGFLRTIASNPSLLIPEHWSFDLFFSGQGPAPIEGFEWTELGPGINHLELEERTETALVFKLVLKNVPEWILPLIKSVIVQLKDDRGDIQDVQFLDFIIDEDGNWSDTAMFKIDAGYSMEPIAIIDITDIKIKFNANIKPDFRGSEIIDKLQSEMNDFKQEIITFLKENMEYKDGLAQSPEVSLLKRELNEGYSLEGLKNSSIAKSVFTLIKQRFKEPRFGTMKVEIGGGKEFIDKFLEFLQPKFIFISSGTTIASSMLLILTYTAIFSPKLNLLGDEWPIFDTVYTTTEIIVYIFVYGFLFIFLLTSILSWLRYQRKKKKQRL